jgi:hypothetical protein
MNTGMHLHSTTTGHPVQAVDQRHDVDHLHSKLHVLLVGGAYALKDGLNDAVLANLAEHLH